MIWSRIRSFLKLCWLYFTRLFRHLFKGIQFKLSYLLVFFSFLVSLFFLLPSLFHNVPVFSYFIDTLSLPISYELNGKVVIINAEGNNVDQSVVVNVGGYSTTSNTGEEFILKLTSVSTNCFYVTVEYTDFNKSTAYYTTKIETNGNTVLKEEIVIYV